MDFCQGLRDTSMERKRQISLSKYPRARFPILIVQIPYRATLNGNDKIIDLFCIQGYTNVH